MDQIQRFSDDQQIEQEAHLLDLGNMEQLATFIASVAVSETVGESAVGTVHARIETFRKQNDSDSMLQLENSIYRKFRQYRREGVLKTEPHRLQAEALVGRLFPRTAPN